MSTVIPRASDATLVLPATSVAVTVMLCAPSLNAPGVKLQSPAPSAVVVPRLPSTSEKTSTVLLASAVPLSVGVVSFVMSSLAEIPVSDPAVRSGAPGLAGAPVSTL